ncbi:MAG: carboxypeptidase regulatory-like domain-containing protein [Acidobacteriaceae bacterium]
MTSQIRKHLPSLFYFSLIALAILLLSSTGRAQTENATLQGSVTDPSGAVIPEAQVTIINAATGVARTVSTNSAGQFTAVGLNPGTYSLRVEHGGFKASEVNGIVLSVGGREELPIQLTVGTATQTVTVNGSAIPLLTTSPAVSTVVNQQEVANMPLNGRSFQDLMLMVPGVTTMNPQTASSISDHNGVSLLQVNGDDGYSNAFTVDGVSANFGSDNNGGFAGIGGAGGLAASTILGTTQALVPVDDLQEFRVETNSYAAEYGGYSGGQFVFVTRSGTNKFHGSASDYYRDTIFDANDYFNNYYGTPRQPMLQNDFAGTFGGPVLIPHVYNGKDKTFFFLNYEGLRSNLPGASYLQYVPTASARASASGAMAGFLNSFPTTNVANAPDLGDGLTTFVAGYPSLNNLNTYDLRIDQVLTRNEELFVRASNTNSTATSYFLAQIEHLKQNTRMYTAGLTSSFGSHVTNQFRANFSLSAGPQSGGDYVQPGADPYNMITAGGYPANIPNIYIGVFYYPAVGSLYSQAYLGVNETRQVDIPDNVTWVVGRHQMKFGVDYRILNSTQLPESPLVGYEYYSEGTLLANTSDYIYNYSYGSFYPGIWDFGAYAQDQWQVNNKLSVSYGLRWDLMPPPTVRRGSVPYTLINQDNLSALALGSPSAPYDTYNFDFAPRLGVTYLARTTPGYETQVRGGAGIFYNAAANEGNAQIGFYSPGFSDGNSFCPYSYCNVVGTYSLPLPAQYLYTQIQYPPVAPFTSLYYAIAPHFANPYTVQGNFAVQQDFGAHNALTLNYVGALYRKGVEFNEIYVYPYNPNFQFVDFETNGLRSAYNSGQFTFQHNWNKGLYAYAGYTWAHDITQNQLNAFTPYQKGNSGSDLRNNFNAVLTWDIPYTSGNRAADAFIAHWGVDVRFMARTGFPITLYGTKASSAASDGQSVSPGLNFVPNQPLYLHGTYQGAEIPSGVQLNPAAFTSAAVGVNGTVPQNYFRGYGMSQWNTAIRRNFPIHDNLNLQLRAEAFNLINRANFGAIDDYLPDLTFGQATDSLAAALTPGASSAQYQSGGPRELQMALKILF